MTMLFHAHSGFRYLVLLLGVAAVLWDGVALVRGKGFGRVARILGSVFVGLLDLQILLGLILLWTIPFYPALYGHVVTMLLAGVLAHGLSIANRRRQEPGPGLALLAAALPLVLVVLGILAIGRPVLG